VPKSARSNRNVVIAALFVVLLVGGTWVVASRQQSPQQAAANATPPPDTNVLVPVERRRLEKPLVFRCSGSTPIQVNVDLPLLPEGFVPVITGIGVGSSGEAKEGMVLLEVSNRPVILLYGTLPAYRSLHAGDTGKDVVQLQRALRRLGLTTAVDGEFGSSTQRAVSELYRFRRYSPLYDDSAAEQGPRVPMGEIVFVPRFPAYAKLLVGKAKRVEDGPLAEIFAGQILIRGTVPSTDANALKQGLSVEIADDLAGTSFAGKIVSIGPSTEGEFGQGRVVSIAPLKPLMATTLGADFRCSSVIARTEDTALVVPITAVLADPAGGNYVLVSDRAGLAHRVDVTIGLSATTYVEIRPKNIGDIDAGDLVVVGDRG
jgi:peptidoglycan hydrolase-like protein with peptidoglycan-binding domain